MPAIPPDEIEELTERLRAAVNDTKLAVHVPAERMLELASVYTAGREALDGFVNSIEDADVINDLAARLETMREVLFTIAYGNARASREVASRMRATARRALRDDNAADREMIAEFEYGLHRLRWGADEPDPKDDPELQALPAIGELRRDALGNVWRVAEYDDERDFAKLELVTASKHVEVEEVVAATSEVRTPAEEPARETTG